MQVTDLQIGQHITANYWFEHGGYDDCATINGTVTRKLTGTAEVEVASSSPPRYNGQRIWIDRRTEILSINN